MESKWTPHKSEIHPQLLTVPQDRLGKERFDEGVANVVFRESISVLGDKDRIDDRSGVSFPRAPAVWMAHADSSLDPTAACT